MKIGDVIRIAVNSLSGGVIDKEAAIRMLEDAVSDKCKKCSVKRDLIITLQVIERSLEQETERRESILQGYPLDTLLVIDALTLHDEKGFVFNCDNGHTLSMYQETVQDTNKVLEVENYGETKRVACI